MKTAVLKLSAADSESANATGGQQVDDICSVSIETDVPLPEVPPDSILIQVRACGLRWLQPWVLKELFKNSDKESFTFGQDVSGVVTQIGSQVNTIQKGDEVVGIVPLDYNVSGCSDYVILREFDAVIKPHSVGFVESASIIGDAVRSYTALHYLGRISSGDTVLILGGATSFGSTLIQLATHWGANVYTTYTNEDQASYLATLQPEPSGAIDMSSHTNTPGFLRTAVMEETGGLGLDLIIDQGVNNSPQSHDVGDFDKEWVPSKHEIMSCLGVGGRWITSQHDLQLSHADTKMLFLRCASIGFLFEQAWMLSCSQQGRYQHILMDIMEKIEHKDIRPNIQKVLSFEDVPEAYKGLAQNEKIGKVVVRM